MRGTLTFKLSWYDIYGNTPKKGGRRDVRVRLGREDNTKTVRMRRHDQA